MVKCSVLILHLRSIFGLSWSWNLGWNFGRVTVYLKCHVFFRSQAAAYWCDVIAIIVVMSCLTWERKSSLSREGLRWLKNHLFPKEKNCRETWVTFWMLGGQEVEEMRCLVKDKQERRGQCWFEEILWLEKYEFRHFKWMDYEYFYYYTHCYTQMKPKPQYLFSQSIIPPN